MTGTELAIKLGFIVSKDSFNVSYDNISLLSIEQEKEFNISNEIRNLSIENLKKEINKCVVLCSNCHRKLHYYDLSIDELRQLYSVPEAA